MIENKSRILLSQGQQPKRNGKTQGQIINVFDEAPEDYADIVDRAIRFTGKDLSFFTAYKVEFVLDLLGGAESAKRSSVLDFGCGPGLIHPYLEKKLGSLKALDISRPMLDFAKKRNPWVDYYHFDGKISEFPDESFDLVLAFGVFHHVPPFDRYDVAREIVRVLRPSGKILVFEHNPLSPFTQYIVRTCHLDRDAKLLFAKATIQVLERVGLSHMDFRYVMFFPFDNPVIKKIEKILGWLPFGAQYAVTAEKI